MSFLEGQPLGYLLSRVASALRTQVVTTVLEPLELAFPQYICLRMLSHSPGLSNAELARGANVSRQAMNIVLQRLEDRGLVTRPDSVRSGRALPAELTRAGLDLLAQVDIGVGEAERTVLANLSERDRRELKRLLAAVGS
ncbi:MarR family winged helix-turn-helix transcriptional regulator [Mycolicibacterium komossense]|nr:MarR family transcriptional regulator [Mycolicibacterium komossense]